MVVDCDSHIMEPADLWRNYLESEYVDRAIRIEQGAAGEQLLIADQVVLPFGLAGLGGVEHDRAELFAGKLTYADGCPTASYETQARLSLLDSWRVDACVTFPTIGILPFPTDDLDLISAYHRAYNRWQADFAKDSAGRILPIAVINWRDIDAAVEELDWCLAAGFKGLFVPPEVIDKRRPSHSHFDPIWSRLQDADLPGALHVIVRFGGSAVSFAGWHEAEPSPGPIFGFGLGASGQMIPALAAMIVDGLFDRFPKLKILSVEAGCGWAAYLMDRLDEKKNALGSMVAGSLQLQPSDYVRRNCYFVAEPEERTIGSMLDLVGADNIVWGSDYPHIDSTLEAPVLIRESIAALTPTRQQAVLGSNAAKLFRLTG